jgi:RHS repeat-associated protein
MNREQRMNCKSFGLIAFALLAGVANGQAAPDGEFAPQNFSLVDANGVDIAERTLGLSQSISIGDPSNGGLSYSVTYSSSHVWLYHNSMMAHILRTTMYDEQTGSWSTAWALQSRGSLEAMFLDSTGQALFGDKGSRILFTSNGSILNATLADGSIMLVESVPVLGMLTSTSQTDVFRASSITGPTGERQEFFYGPGETGLQAITNNRGYQLRFIPRTTAGTGLKAPSSVVLFNMAIDACSPSASSCPAFTKSWPRLNFEYYPSGQLRAIVSTGGSRTEYTYDSQNQRIVYIDGPGSADMGVTYQNCGALPPNGQCAVGGIGGKVGGYRVSTINRGGRTWTYTWDPALTNASQFERGTRVTSASGYVGYRVAVAPTFGMAWNDFYVGASTLLSIKDELGRVTLMQHGGLLNPVLTKVTYPEGNGTQYTYDSRMNLASVRNFAKPGSGLADQVTTITRIEGGGTDQCSQPSTCNKAKLIRDPRGFVRRFSWTAAGQMQSEEAGLTGPDSSLTCALGANLCPKAEFVYATFQAYYKNAQGQLTAGSPISLQSSARRCVSSANCNAGSQVVTSMSYGSPNVANNLFLRSVGTGLDGQLLVTGYTYDEFGNRTEVDGPRSDVGDLTRYSYDADRRVVLETSADLSAKQTIYTPEGMIASSSIGTVNGAGQFTAWQTTSNVYDAGGYLTKVTTPASVKQMSYDGAGRLVCVASRMNPAVYSSLPADACAPSPSGPNGPDRIVLNSYNVAGELLSVQRAYGTSLQQVYASYAYTLNSKQDWVQDANGNRSDFSYDGFDRLSKQTYPSPISGSLAINPSDYELYDYDSNGNRVSTRLRSGEYIGTTYDAVNRPILRDYPAGPVSDEYLAYDLLGRLVSIGEGQLSNTVISYTYDAWGRQVTEASNGRTLTYQYDEAGNRTRLVWPDGNHIQLTFDAMNRMDQVRENSVTSGLGLLADYTYDAIGRRTGVIAGNGTSQGFAYDLASRPATHSINLSGTVQDNESTYSYNNASQIISRALSNDIYRYLPPQAASQTYVANGLNQYSSVSGVPYTYDGRGNLLSDGVRTFTYDLRNRLINVSGAGGAQLIAISYDPLSRIRQMITSFGTTSFLYAGEKLVGEYDSNGAMTQRYVHGAGVDEALVRYEGPTITGGSRKWLHANLQHSIVGSSDESGHLIGAALAYSPFGEPDSGNGWAGVRFRYTGQLALPEARLYHFRARAYDPGLGRFLQTDPAGFEDDLNLYAYVGNDPLNNLDFSGKGKIKIFLAALEKIGDKLNLSKVKQITEKEAVKVREGLSNADGTVKKKPGNVIVEGDHSSKVGQRIEEKAAGRGNESKVERHDKHEEGGLDHYQTKGKDGHTFTSSVGLLTATAYLGEDSKVAAAVDLVNPASDVADLVELFDEAMADYEAAVAEAEKPAYKPSIFIKDIKRPGDCASKATASTPCVEH